MVQGVPPVHGSSGSRSARWPRRAKWETLRDEAAADANRVFRELFGPDTLETDADGRKDRNVENGEKRVRHAFGNWEIESDAAKTEVYYASAMGRLIAEDGVGIGAGHGNTLRLAGYGEDARLLVS